MKKEKASLKEKKDIERKNYFFCSSGLEKEKDECKKENISVSVGNNDNKRWRKQRDNDTDEAQEGQRNKRKDGCVERVCLQECFKSLVSQNNDEPRKYLRKKTLRNFIRGVKRFCAVEGTKGAEGGLKSRLTVSACKVKRKKTKIKGACEELKAVLKTEARKLPGRGVARKLSRKEQEDYPLKEDGTTAQSKELIQKLKCRLESVVASSPVDRSALNRQGTSNRNRAKVFFSPQAPKQAASSKQRGKDGVENCGGDKATKSPELMTSSVMSEIANNAFEPPFRSFGNLTFHNSVKNNNKKHDEYNNLIRSERRNCTQLCDRGMFPSTEKKEQKVRHLRTLGPGFKMLQTKIVPGSDDDLYLTPCKEEKVYSEEDSQLSYTFSKRKPSQFPCPTLLNNVEPSKLYESLSCGLQNSSPHLPPLQPCSSQLSCSQFESCAHPPPPPSKAPSCTEASTCPPEECCLQQCCFTQPLCCPPPNLFEQCDWCALTNCCPRNSGPRAPCVNFCAAAVEACLPKNSSNGGESGSSNTSLRKVATVGEKHVGWNVGRHNGVPSTLLEEPRQEAPWLKATSRKFSSDADMCPPPPPPRYTSKRLFPHCSSSFYHPPAFYTPPFDSRYLYLPSPPYGIPPPRYCAQAFPLPLPPPLPPHPPPPPPPSYNLTKFTLNKYKHFPPASKLK